MNVDVLVDRKANDLSLLTTGDDGVDTETTLTVEGAWDLVVKLNTALRQLQAVPQVTHINIDARGASNPALVAAAINRAISVLPVKGIIERKPERVKDAVLEAIGADQKRPRHVPPGFPATVTKRGLREYVEPAETTQ